MKFEIFSASQSAFFKLTTSDSDRAQFFFLEVIEISLKAPRHNSSTHGLYRRKYLIEKRKQVKEIMKTKQIITGHKIVKNQQ
jgi:hypothetical protein